MPILETFRDIFWKAALIVQAMLWSSFFESAFAVLYWKIKGGEAEKEECGEQVGHYACGYQGENKDLEWAVILPAFFVAIVVTVVLLYSIAKLFTKFWVEFVTG